MLLTGLATLASATTARADVVYRPTLGWLCFLADAVVEADVVDRSTLTITRVIATAPAPSATSHPVRLAPGAALELPVLSTVDMDVGSFGATSPGGPIQPTRVLVFLTRDKATGAYRLTATGTQGTPSTYWGTADGAAFGYVQNMNPGDLELVAGSSATPNVPASWRELRSRVAAGLRERAMWETLVKLPPRHRAARLVAYLQPHTASPSYVPDTIPYRVIRGEVRRAGAAAVEPLIDQLKTAPTGADLSATVLSLMDLGPAARPALGPLKTLRSAPGATHVGYIDSAIQAITAPSAAGQGAAR